MPILEQLENIAALIESGGEITLGHLGNVRTCVATATDDAQCLAMLVQSSNESLEALLQHLDAAINDSY